MSCCGKSRSDDRRIIVYEFRDVYYNSGNDGEQSVYSTLFDQHTGRRMLINSAAVHGQILSVPVQDILARPELFLAPCGQPFVITGQSVVDPCAQQTVDEPPGLESLPADPPAPVVVEEATSTQKADALADPLEEAGFGKSELAAAGIVARGRQKKGGTK